ncbi:MAG: hypothetical protein KF833_13060 [Verrucomicrobiae bacterium]|nr:hypothetical protein [Verrucomicrobiae bacterium]
MENGGWLFLSAKPASAATAALGLAGYVRLAFGQSGATARIVVALVAIGLLTLVVACVDLTWSFRAVTVLVYYTLTHLAALRLPKESRLYPRRVPVCGLVSWLGLAFWVEPGIGLAGLVLMGAGLLWHKHFRRRARKDGRTEDPQHDRSTRH